MDRTSDHPGSPGISIVMAAHDEQAVIGSCLASVAELADEIVVVDAGSRDRTAALAEEHGALVLAASNELMFNSNKNRAIDLATREWVLVLDPDERVSSELADELRAIASSGECDGYWIPMRTYFMGRWIRALGYHPCHQLRFFRRGKGRFPCRAVHEKLDVDGHTSTLHAPLLHFPPGGVAKAVQKQNLYSEYHAFARQRDGGRFSLARLLLSPPHMFLRRYLAESGWREGIPGVVLSVQSAYSVFLIHAKLWEREAGKDAGAAELLGASDPVVEERTRRISRRSDVPSVFSVEGQD